MESTVYTAMKAWQLFRVLSVDIANGKYILILRVIQNFMPLWRDDKKNCSVHQQLIGNDWICRLDAANDAAYIVGIWMRKQQETFNKNLPHFFFQRETSSAIINPTSLIQNPLRAFLKSSDTVVTYGTQSTKAWEVDTVSPAQR